MSAALIEQFDLLATSTGGIAKLRELILSLAVRGQLVPQNSADEPASELLKKIRTERDRLIAEGKIKRDKPLAEIGEDEKPYELPMGWEWVRLSAILPFRIGKTPPTKDDRYWTEGGIPWVSISDMEHLGVVTHTSRTISQAGAEVFSYAPLPAGTLVMSFKLTIGKIAVLGVPAYHNEAIASFLPLGGMGTDFLKWILPAAAAGGASKDALMGATLNSDSLANLLFALPPLAEQSRIAAKVEELMALCDRLEAEQDHAARVQGHWVEAALDQLAESADADDFRRHWQHLAEHFDTLFTTPASIERLNATLLQLAVRGKLVPQVATDAPVILTDADRPDVLPQSWGWSQFGGLLTDLRYGTSQKCSYETQGVPVLRIPNLVESAVSCSDLKFGALSDDELARLRLRSGDLLMIRSNGSANLVGRAALVGEDAEGFAFAGYLVRLRLDSAHMTPQFALLVLASQSIREQIERPIRTTSGVKNINSSEIKRLLFPVPPIEEQSRIVTQVEKLLALTAELKVRLSAAQSKQAHLAETLIAEVC